MVEEQKDFRYLVRIANTDLKGEIPVAHALTKIKGISFMFSNAILAVTDINKTQKIGTLGEDEIKKIDAIIKDPLKYNIPMWLYNRRNDPETGLSSHLITSDIDFTRDNDIKIMKKIKSYRGVRHIFNLPVRGQRTKSNFRKNKGKVTGVKRKAGMKAGRV
jgi:small subunit ribosomal protein S13